MVTQAFSVFSVVVFIYLVVYANRFILRRRSNEFAICMTVAGLAVTLGSTSFASIVAGTIGITVALLGVYFVFTSRANERMLLGSCLE